MDYAVSHLWVKTRWDPGLQGGLRIGEWEVLLLSGCCMGLFDHYFVLNSRRVRGGAQEEGSSCLHRRGKKRSKYSKDYTEGCGVWTSGSQACGGQSSQHTHGLPQAQPLPLRPGEPFGRGDWLVCRTMHRPPSWPQNSTPVIFGAHPFHQLPISDLPYSDLFLFSCPQYLHCLPGLTSASILLLSARCAGSALRLRLPRPSA